MIIEMRSPGRQQAVGRSARSCRKPSANQVGEGMAIGPGEPCIGQQKARERPAIHLGIVAATPGQAPRRLRYSRFPTRCGFSLARRNSIWPFQEGNPGCHQTTALLDHLCTIVGLLDLSSHLVEQSDLRHVAIEVRTVRHPGPEGRPDAVRNGREA